jgi:hypothetical protein
MASLGNVTLVVGELFFLVEFHVLYVLSLGLCFVAQIAALLRKEYGTKVSPEQK